MIVKLAWSEGVGLFAVGAIVESEIASTSSEGVMGVNDGDGITAITRNDGYPTSLAW